MREEFIQINVTELEDLGYIINFVRRIDRSGYEIGIYWGPREMLDE